VVKVRSFTELCGLQVTMETYVAPKGPLQCKRCQRLGQTQRYCCYALRCFACGEAHFSGECSAPQQQLKCCSGGGNHTANYRGCAKWKEGKAALARKARVERNKADVTANAPKEKEVEPSAEQKSRGPSWNHVVSGDLIIKAATPRTPKPAPGPVPESPTRSEVTTTRAEGKTAKSSRKSR
jgi:hypothetical protein